MDARVKSLNLEPAGNDAAGLVVISQAGYAEWLAEQATPKQRRYCKTPGFAGRAGQIQPVHNKHGVDHYIAVVGDTTAAPGFGHLPKKLPDGNYKVIATSGDFSIDDLVLGWAMGAYSFDKYLSRPQSRPVLHVPEEANAESVMRMAAAIQGTRDLINMPANDMGVSALAAHAIRLAERFNIHARRIDVVDDKEFPLVWHVGKAAQEKPCVVDFSHETGFGGDLRVTLIGKGVVYDTGGLAIKTQEGMLNMKKDMGGAAHALALAGLILDEKLPINLRVIIPIVENAINERALRNGDIVSSRSGATIEITNTDAEGRLILADALTLAGEGGVPKPDLIIDFATLTGAARLASEPGTPAIFCDDKSISRALEDIGDQIQDRVQPFALDRRSAAKIRSLNADFSNSSGVLPSHIYAAHFLNAFSPAGVTRLHIDQSAWSAEGGMDQSLRATYAYLRRRALNP